jgi:ATP-dependent helicase/nuclease subunit B
VPLRGVIDRIDVAESGERRIAVVIDYKSRLDPRLPLDEVVHGISLQLPAYLLVAAGATGAAAGGAFYVSLAPSYVAVDHPREHDPESPSARQHAPRGILALDVASLLERDVRGGRWARHYGFFMKEDGSLGHVDAGDAAPRAAFDALLGKAREKLGALADGILSGEVAPSPYRLRRRSPCRHCELRAACRFEFSQPSLRSLPALRRSEVLGLAPREDRAEEAGT